MRWSEADLAEFRTRRIAATSPPQPSPAVSPPSPAATPRKARAPKQVDLPLGDAPRKATRKNTSPTEFHVHRGVVEHLKKLGRPDIVYLHPANGEARDARTAAKLKAMGVQPGAPDLLIVIGGQLYCLELKRERGSYLSEAQKAMHRSLIAAGAIVATARGLDEAIEILKSWGAFGPVSHREGEEQWQTTDQA